jgi:hypothetical protein
MASAAAGVGVTVGIVESMGLLGGTIGLTWSIAERSWVIAGEVLREDMSEGRHQVSCATEACLLLSFSGDSEP